MNTNTYSEDAAIIMQNLQTVKKQTEDLEIQLKQVLARGTGDVTAQAKEVTATLASRLEELLKFKPHTLDELAKATKLPAIKLMNDLKTFKSEKKVSNVGTEIRPRYFWKVGANPGTKETQDAVLRLISDTPLSFAEICVATGTKGSLVQGALVEIRRSGAQVQNYGTKTRARYFILPANAIDARLEPKPKKGL